MSAILLNQGDYGIEINSQFLEDKLPVDITNKDIIVAIVFPDKKVHEYPGKIVNGVNGEVSIVLIKEMTEQIGDYVMYFKVADSKSQISAKTNVIYTVTSMSG